MYRYGAIQTHQVVAGGHGYKGYMDDADPLVWAREDSGGMLFVDALAGSAAAGGALPVVAGGNQ